MVATLLPHSPAAYNLLQEGLVALSRVEANGIRINEDYLDTAIAKTHRRIDRKNKKLAKSEVRRIWRARFKDKTNYDSNDQLGKVLFEDLGLDCPGVTASGKYKTDEDTLARVNHPYVKRRQDIVRLQTGLKFLKGIKEEVCEGLLHPVFNLHLVSTYRSSSDSPNFQNFPVRDPELKKLVRSAFVARPGHCIVEVDIKGVEVGVAYCYHEDPAMKKYLLDKSKDMHRDMAAKCYMIPKDTSPAWWGSKAPGEGKDVRYCGKNQFVFPEFYGSWWLDCAKNLWDSALTMNLKMEDGTSLIEHLKSQGITELGDQNRKDRDPREGTFEAHIQSVERWFWDKKFSGYAQWKKDWYADYQKQGWFQTKTGFICQGYMKRNEVINYPVQGAAFHTLLQVLIWLVNEELDKRKMKAKVVGQIHDSLVSDVPKEEVAEFVALVRKLFRRLQKHWDWVLVPLEIEIEITPVDGTWVDKKLFDEEKAA